jgi:hypothetical protein
VSSGRRRELPESSTLDCLLRQQNQILRACLGDQGARRFERCWMAYMRNYTCTICLGEDAGDGERNPFGLGAPPRWDDATVDSPSFAQPSLPGAEVSDSSSQCTKQTASSCAIWVKSSWRRAASNPGTPCVVHVKALM